MAFISDTAREAGMKSKRGKENTLVRCEKNNSINRLLNRLYKH